MEVFKVLKEAGVAPPPNFLEKIFEEIVIDDPEWRAYDPNYEVQKFELLPIRIDSLSIIDYLIQLGIPPTERCLELVVNTHCVSLVKILVEKYNFPLKTDLIDTYLNEFGLKHRMVTSMLKHLSSKGLKAISSANQRLLARALKQ
jgi:hypothetical protein